MRELQNSISADGQVRRETKNGIEYLVFPSIIAREGVMNYPEFGRDEYLPAEHLEQTIDRWADMPITVNHPPDRGEGRTAKVPESYTSEVIGRTFNPELVGGDRVKVENWVDIERANSFGGIYAEMVDTLESGEGQVGVSTGYATLGDEPESGSFKGNSYDLRQGVPDPNHVALVTPDRTPRMGPEDGVGAPRLNHVTMSDSPDGSIEATESQNPALIERARAFGAAFRESFGFAPDESEVTTNAEAPPIRTNVEVGDAVRWESSSGGEREPDDYRYGVVVDGLQDGPDDSVLVAVYQSDSDYEGWENRNEQQSMQEDTLETVGSDGVESLPAVSQVITTNTINDPDDEGDDAEVESNSDSDGSEEAEADDSDEADAESTDSNTTLEDPDDGEDAGSEETETDLLESMSDNDNESDFDRDETIESLDSDEDVPFDVNVLEEMTDEQILTISPDAADGDEAPDVDDGGKEEGVDEEDADASAEDADEDDTVPDDGEGESEDEEAEENPDADAQTETETTDSPETPGDDSTTKVEMTVNELEERLNSIEEELEETKQENQELREKVDPDVLQAKQARKQLAEATETDADELAALPDETAINMAANLSDGAGMARANTMPGQQTQSQQRPNMAGAPGPVSRTNTEDEDLPPAGREAYEQRKNGDS